jgi:hypothetical protein
MARALQDAQDREDDSLFVYNLHSIFSATYDLATAPLPRTLREALAGPERGQWLPAFTAEVDSIIRAKVWYLVPLSAIPKGYHVLGGRWSPGEN